LLGTAVNTKRLYVLFYNFLDVFRDVLLKFQSSFLQSVVDGNLLSQPHDVCSTYLPHRHVVVIFGEGPVTLLANLRVLQLLPIDAVLTRPRLGAIRRPT